MNVGMLYELLDRLPSRCDDFKVRFILHDRTNWIQPEYWYVDESGDLMLTLQDEAEDYDNEYTVDDLKDILDGYWNDECDEGQEVYDWREVFIKDVEWIGDDYPYGPSDTYSTYYDILADRFEINWKRERVDVLMEYS